MTEKRDCRIYYVPCPIDSFFILKDPADPMQKSPPESPCKTRCGVCGHEVNVTEPWTIGYVSAEERDKEWTFKKPAANKWT